MSRVGFRHVVVGIDLDSSGRSISSGSERSLELARWLVLHAGCDQITLVNSHAPDEKWLDTAGHYIYAAPGLAEATETLNGLVERCADLEVDVRFEQSAKHPDIALAEACTDFGADLLVLGRVSARGHTASRLGSVASKMLRHCPCSVWVTRPEPDAPVGPRRVLAASQGDEIGAHVVETAVALTGPAGQLDLVRAVTVPMSLQLHNEPDGTAIQSLRSEAKADFEALLGKIAKEAAPATSPPRASIHIGITSPTRAILECVARLDPDLVVLGTCSRRGVAGFLVGNTAERLFERLECAILAVKG